MKPAIDVNEIKPRTAHLHPEPFASRLGAFEGRNLSEHFGLTQFGAHMETLQPDSQSALRHWHTLSDELVYMLEGELTLVTDDGESLLKAGMCTGFQAGVENGHHLINRSEEPATFLVVGTKVNGDEVHYPDDDLRWVQGEDGVWHPVRKDGTKY